MRFNPFTSNIYQELWFRYFEPNQTVQSFKFIDPLTFYKHKFLPYYINAGKNSTNGITYDVKNDLDFSNKTLLIYDVADYERDTPINIKQIGRFKIPQYKGFLADFSEFENFDKYLASIMSSKSRSKLRGVSRKFEACFEVKTKFYFGETPHHDIEKVLANFKKVLTSRHDSLGIDTNILSKWNFYKELLPKMINQKKALIIAVYADDKPVAMSLAFVGDKKLIGAVKAFDPDYYKFNIGHFELMKLIEWCFENNFEILDFSKGEYEYKTKWTNKSYRYSCHIFYDKKSFQSVVMAFLLSRYFSLKQFLRDRNINYLFVSYKYKLKNLFQSKPNYNYKTYPIQGDTLDFDQCSVLEIDSVNKSELRRIILDNLFKSPELYRNLKLYQDSSVSGKYYLIGSNSQIVIELA